MPLPSIPEYSTSIKTPALIHPSILDNGHPIEKGVRLIKYSGGFCVVFPFETPTNKYAIRCWHAEVADAKKRTQLIADALKNSQLPYFVGFNYYEDGIMTTQGIQPIVVMDWVEAKSLKKYLSSHINDSSAINELAENFKTMVSDLHKHEFSHGDLQHGNIMVKDDKSLVLVDYDSMYVPSLNGMLDEIKGLVGYQHEGRWTNKYVSKKADYFSELVIYLSLKALAKYPQLWIDLKMEDTETLLFSGEDIKSRGCTPIFKFLSADPDLSILTEKLIEFMKMGSIDELLPLEDVIISKSSGIASKWQKGNGYSPRSSGSIIEKTDTIAGKWKSGNGYSRSNANQKVKDEIINNICLKFKKR